jgi:hypothetical protein
VVAEGVEDAVTALALQEAGCDIGQGYFWSRPLPPDELVEWLTQLDSGAKTHPGVASNSTKDQHAVTAMRGLFAARTPVDLRDVLVGFVTNVGGYVVGADDVYQSGVMQFDLSLGEGDAVLPVADPGTLARQHLEELLPMLLAGAQLVLVQQRAM